MEHLKIVVIFTIGFGLASLFGYIAQRIKLSVILGYLFAGFLIGPYSYGFIADKEVSEQLAEIGVILMLFSVGSHFKPEDLIKVKNIAVPGAILQTVTATLASVIFISLMGWPMEMGLIIGLAIGVASTVVMVKILTDKHLLNTPEGHISVGWLVVEDIITVTILALIPIFESIHKNMETSLLDTAGTIILILVEFILLTVFMFLFGPKIVAYILKHVARMRSDELYTVTTVALIFLIAFLSYFIFGLSIALGAFIAGMVIGQTSHKYHADTQALPIKDLFSTIFFLSIGMLFNPWVILEQFPTFLIILAIILILKPLVAYAIVELYGYRLKIALTVAFALAQIGEFSFILAEVAARKDLLSDEGYDLIVAAAFFTIPLNPLLFQLIDFLDKKFGKQHVKPHMKTEEIEASPVIVVGFGPIGQAVVKEYHKYKIYPLIIERNIDTVETSPEGSKMLFGDAMQANTLKMAKIETAKTLIITVPDIDATIGIIRAARRLNPNIRIVARVVFVMHTKKVEAMNVDVICSEVEAAKVFIKKITLNQ